MPKINIKLKPWQTPNYVIPYGNYGDESDSKWHVRDVDVETLSEMCDDFRAEVFRKANKKDPRSVVK